MKSQLATGKKPLVVDMTVGTRTLAKVPDTLLLVEASNHEVAKQFVNASLDPSELQPGTTNVRRADQSRKWWVFGVFL